MQRVRQASVTVDGEVVGTTGATAHDFASLGVTTKLGYAPNGGTDRLRRGELARTLHFEMPRAHWEANLRRDDIELHGVEACRPLFGLT